MLPPGRNVEAFAAKPLPKIALSFCLLAQACLMLRALARDPSGAFHVKEVAWQQKPGVRSEEHTSELQSRGQLVCRLLLEKKNHKRSIRLITDTGIIMRNRTFITHLIVPNVNHSVTHPLNLLCTNTYTHITIIKNSVCSTY